MVESLLRQRDSIMLSLLSDLESLGVIIGKYDGAVGYLLNVIRHNMKPEQYENVYWELTHRFNIKLGEGHAPSTNETRPSWPAPKPVPPRGPADGQANDASVDTKRTTE